MVGLSVDSHSTILHNTHSGTIPSVPEIYAALEEAYKRGKGKSEKAIEFASAFDHEKVWQE
jgi:hypothetical protein